MARLTVADTDLPAVVTASGFEFTCGLPGLPEVQAVIALVKEGDRAAVTDHQGDTWNGVVTHVAAEGTGYEVTVNAERRNWW